METVIVKNVTGLRIFFEDLGIGIDARSSRILSDLFPLYIIKSSMDFALQVKAENIILNNGIKDFTKLESKEFFTL
jgi:hypothetical protein